MKFTLTHLTTSPDNPIRQVTYTCGNQSHTEITLPEIEPIEALSVQPIQDDQDKSTKAVFSRWTNFK